MQDALQKGESKQIFNDNLVELANFVLENNYFELNGEVKQQISRNTIGTTFPAPPHVCIFVDQVKSDFFSSGLMAKRN